MCEGIGGDEGVDVGDGVAVGLQSVVFVRGSECRSTMDPVLYCDGGNCVSQCGCVLYEVEKIVGHGEAGGWEVVRG